MMMTPEVIGLVLVAVLLIVVLARVLTVQGKATEVQTGVQSGFAELNERLTELEERIARIEGAVFFGPAAAQALRRGPVHPRSGTPSDPGIPKRL